MHKVPNGVVTFHTAGIIQRKQRNSSLIEPGREQLYVTDGYVNHLAASWWARRADGDPARDPASFAGAVREVVRRAGSETLINEMQPMDSLVVQAQAQTRFSLLLIGVFSTIAALLAGVGLYGVLATSVRQRLPRLECGWLWALRRRASFV